MRKNLFKKVTAAVLALTMIVGSTGIVSADHAANGANVAANGKWSSFSVCTREDGGVWEDALKKVEVLDADGNLLRYQTKGTDYATEGKVDPNATADFARFFIKNTGWDGEYDPNGNLVGDNPWGLWTAFTGVPVELGRYYTVSFKIKSSLIGSTTVKDVAGNVVTDGAGNELKEDVTTKHLTFKAYDPVSKGEPGVTFVDISGAEATPAGYLTVNYSADKTEEDMATGWEEVTAVIKIPESKRLYAADVVGFKFSCGSMLKTYPEEIAMSGSVYIKDFKVTAGTQYKVRLTNGKINLDAYINEGEKVAFQEIGKKKYTLKGYKTSTGAMYNFNTPVTSDLTLTAVYTKTKAPAKPKVKSLKSTARKKVKLTLKNKVKNAKGYQIKYSYKKNMKAAKTKTTTRKTYTLKKLKSGKIVYVQVRAYTLDSLGNKVWGKYSAKKKAYVK